MMDQRCLDRAQSIPAVTPHIAPQHLPLARTQSPQLTLVTRISTPPHRPHFLKQLSLVFQHPSQFPQATTKPPQLPTISPHFFRFVPQIQAAIQFQMHLSHSLLMPMEQVEVSQVLGQSQQTPVVMRLHPKLLPIRLLVILQ